MQEQKGNLYSDVIKNLSAFLALALPILQFLQTLLNSKTKFVNFLGDQSVIFPTSLLALLISVFVLLLFKSNPFFRFTLPWQGDKQTKWQEYLRKTNPNLYKPVEIKKVKSVSPPTEVTADSITWFAIPILLVSAFVFIWLGLNYQNKPENFIIILQAILYATTIISAVYILSALASKLSQQDRWKLSRVDRINRAINLAKEHDGFDNFPKINFLQTREEWAQGLLYVIVEVSVGESKYRIITDSDALVLHAVVKEDAHVSK
jgi:hypothetical protein